MPIKTKHVHDIPQEPTRNGALKRALLRHKEVDSPYLMFFNEVYVKPGETITAHQHADMEEIFYFLEGQEVMQIADETHPVTPGDRIIVPAQTMDVLTNTSSDTQMKFVCFGVKAYPMV